jgi:ABC-2 type transport system permease protein
MKTTDQFLYQQKPINQMTAVDDIRTGWSAKKAWSYIAYEDIKKKYRRTFFGPLWISAEYAIFIVTKGLIFSILLKVNIKEFFPYLAAGFLIWRLIVGVINQSTTVFIQSKNIIETLPLPFSFHVFRLVYTQFLNFFHYMLVFIVIAILSGLSLSRATPLFFVGMAVLSLLFVGITFIQGTLCCKFRDIIPLTQSITTLAFFVTPILWKKEMMGRRGWIADYNPFYHLIEIVREPLLGNFPSVLSWQVSISLTVLSLLLALILFAKYRKSIYFWL